MNAEILVLSNRDPDAEAIGELYRRGQSSMVDSVKYLVEAGRRLKAKKDSLRHGEWLPWLADNADLLGFDAPSTAGRFMKAARLCAGAQYDEAGAIRLSRIAWGHNVRGAEGTGKNEWCTPKRHVDLARTVLGAIDLDPATNETAQQSIQAARYFTKADDGLQQEWHGRVWLNPPYSQGLIADFVSKICSERRSGRVTAAIMLTNNSTDTSWFHEAAAVADAICFTLGRVSFHKPEGKEEPNHIQGQAFFYFGDNVAAFVAQFAEVGFVVRPCR